MNRINDFVRLASGQAGSLRQASLVDGQEMARIFSIVALVVVSLFAATPSSAQQPDASKSGETKPDLNQLPPGYTPPPERPAIMDLDLPIADKDEMARLKKEFVNRFSIVRKDCDLTPNGKKVVEGSIRYKLAEMTLKEEQSKLPQLHKRFVDEVGNVGDKSKSPQAIQDMSRFIGQETVKRMPELLKNNFYVRLHAVEILGEMDFAPASELLIKVMQTKDISEDADDGQPEAIRIAAVNGLIRIVRFANATAKERNTIANAVVVELQNSNIFWWRQIRLIEVLRYCDVNGLDIGNNDKPFVVDSLLSVARDNKRIWKVRTRACYALGRVPIPRTAKIDDIVTTVCECAFQLSNDVAAKPKDPNWKRCFANLYLTFQSSSTSREKDLDTEKKQPGGLLGRHKTAAQPAYQVLVPIFNDVKVISDDIYIAKPPTTENLKKLADFIRSRGPNAQALQPNPQASNR